MGGGTYPLNLATQAGSRGLTKHGEVSMATPAMEVMATLVPGILSE